MLLALPFVFYVSNAKDPREHNVVDRVVVFLSAPIQWLTTVTVEGVWSMWDHYVALVGVQEENYRLREQNARLTSELAIREEQRLENERLRLLLGLKDRAPEVLTLHARIVATSPTPLFRSIRIDRGADDGVRIGSAVISHHGVIGRVAALTDGWADVMLLVDSNSSTDVLVQRTRARARVRGTGSDVHLGIAVEFLARSADVEPGDILITSGTGDVFPKGLKVGTVMSVERGAFGLYQRAAVEPSVDFGRLESAMVIVGAWHETTSYEEHDDERGTVGPLLDEPAPDLVLAPGAP